MRYINYVDFSENTKKFCDDADEFIHKYKTRYFEYPEHEKLLKLILLGDDCVDELKDEIGRKQSIADSKNDWSSAIDDVEHYKEQLKDINKALTLLREIRDETRIWEMKQKSY